MNLSDFDFDWDAGNRTKCQRHGISIADIETFFATNPRIAPDHDHSATEERFLAVGRNAAGRAMFVVFTLRRRESEFRIRPISARYMHGKEIEGYETEGS